MTTPFSSNEVLYYPTIELQDTSWLKATICFWDKIYRIVPPSYVPNDSEDVEIAFKNGIIENIVLCDKDLEVTAECFEEFVSHLKFTPAGFSSSDYDIRLHQDKVDQRLHSYFKSFRGNIDNQGFYKVPNNIANGYMFYLANTISKRRGIPKLTDDKDMFAAMTYIDVDGKIGEDLYDSDAKEVYTNLVLDYLIPSDIAHTPIETIIKRNEKLATSKKEFQKIVSTFSNELSKIDDINFAKKRIFEFKDAIAGQKANYSEAIRAIASEFIPSVIYVGFPVLATSLINSFSKKPDDMVFGEALTQGVALASVATIGNIGKEVRKSFKSNNSNYYVDICKKSSENGSFSFRHWRMDRLINEFVND